MCGIFGITHFQGSNESTLQILWKGADSLRHRGPDDAGVEFLKDDRVGLAHRRLSILDLSPNAHQPMPSNSGRFLIAFNGEVYNFKTLKAELADTYAFKSTSDTEVLLAAFERWGVEQTIPRLRGMFAFAVFDRSKKQLFLVRDRLGIKPLYYCAFGNGLAFASELKSLIRTKVIDFSIDARALDSFLAFNFVEGNNAMIKGVRRLAAGHYLKVSTDDGSFDETVEPTCYWQLESGYPSGEKQFSKEEWLIRVRKKLMESVQLRMLADVPLGAFLSGGIDSSLVVAIMQELSSDRIKTFTIRTDEPGYDESVYAQQVATTLGTDHHCFTIDHQKVKQTIERAGSVLDEPMADVSIIPSLLVSNEARKHVTVALTGDGGDEVFGGYNRYFQTPRILKRAGIFPKSIRRRFASTIGASGTEKFLKRSGLLDRMVAGAEKMQKVTRILGATSSEDIYYQLILRNTTFASEDLRLRMIRQLKRRSLSHGEDLARALMQYDIECYLPFDILPKLDVASMNASLEARVPFLDHELYELSLQLPNGMLFSKGAGKMILRELLGKYLDTSLFERPKMGFAIPMAQWLRTDLKDWARDCLFNSRNPAILDKRELDKLWESSMNSKQREDSEVWPILLFLSWYDSMASC